MSRKPYPIDVSDEEWSFAAPYLTLMEMSEPQRQHSLREVFNALQAAQTHGIDLQIVKLPEAKKGFVLLPRRWVVERSFGWLARFRRLTRDYERLPSVLSGLHFLVFAILMLPAATKIMAAAGSS